MAVHIAKLLTVQAVSRKIVRTGTFAFSFMWHIGICAFNRTFRLAPAIEMTKELQGRAFSRYAVGADAFATIFTPLFGGLAVQLTLFRRDLAYMLALAGFMVKGLRVRAILRNTFGTNTFALIVMCYVGGSAAYPTRFNRLDHRQI